MARYGALTALQAALLGISGGAQGLVQAREREQKEAERVRQAEREAARDALERERFGIEQERSRAEQAYRESQLRQQADLAGKEIASREKIAGISAGSAAADRALRQQELDTKRKELLDEAEAWWNQTVIRPGETGTPERKAAAERAARTFNRLRTADKKRDARELIAAAYAAEQAFQLAESRRVQKAPAFTLNAPTTTPDGRPLVPPMSSPVTSPAASVGGGAKKMTEKQAADLWEQLVRDGMSKEAATAEVTRRRGQ